MRSLLTALLILGMLGTSQAASTDEHIAAIEKAVSPLLVIKGESIHVPTLHERMEQLHVAAVSVALFEGGRIEWTKAYGYADKESATLATPATLFQAGSISKPVAALAALQLVEHGTLNLDANVNDKLRSWHLPDNQFTATHKVTLRNILNHTAGTTVWGFPGYARTDKVPSLVEVLDGKGNTEAIRVWKEPDQSWRYSGGGYTIMQLLLSDVSGRSFPDLMQAMVLKPLGMASSTYEQPLPEKWWARAACGYNSQGVRVPGGWHIYPEMAAAGLWTTAGDLARYALAVQRMYHGDGRLLSRQMTHVMLTPGMNQHGLGPVISPDGKRFGHDGADEGFQASLVAYLEGGSGVAIMTNSDNGGQLARELVLAIAREYGWSGFAQIEKTVITLPREVTEKVVGHYRIDGGIGEFDVVAQSGHFVARAPGFPDREFFPESENEFFLRDGTPVSLVLDGGSTALNFGGLHAAKISQ
jgi:CubicO group peptidase (beta-lactamase class C family)